MQFSADVAAPSIILATGPDEPGPVGRNYETKPLLLLLCPVKKKSAADECEEERGRRSS